MKNPLFFHANLGPYSPFLYLTRNLDEDDGGERDQRRKKDLREIKNMV